MTQTGDLRVLVVDDERPARRFLVALLERCGAHVCGEAASGREALDAIEQLSPDLVLLDLQMPEMGGLDVVRQMRADRLPLVAFVTAFDEFAIDAFELNAIDYVLKPAEERRVRATLDRARQRLERNEPSPARAAALAHATAAYERASRRPFVDRLPVKVKHDLVLIPVRQIASLVSEGELLHITTVANERYTITHRLHALEARLDPRRFVRLGRGTLVNIDLVSRVSPMPGGTYIVMLSNGHQLPVSRIQSRVLRETLLRL